MAIVDTLFQPLAQRLLDCWCAQLALTSPAPDKCEFRWDDDVPTPRMANGVDECKCGFGWVRMVTWYPTTEDTFPDADPEPQVCPRLWALVLEMGVGRCPPDGDAQTLPTSAQMLAFQELIMGDGKGMRNAIACCFTMEPLGTGQELGRVSLGQPTRSGPAGKCLQQYMEVTVMVGACDEC